MARIFIFSILVLSLSNIVNSNVLENATSWFSSISNSVSNYYCDYYECCDDQHVPYDIKSLQTMLHTKLYGQHIAIDIVLNAINSHIKKSKPSKPLVMSFHGANGVGKSYVSRIIANAFYEKGENSRFFHFYYGLDNFPLVEKISEYQTQLKYEIENAISKCERSLFVFDGVDFMPPDLLNVLMPFIDCRNCAGKAKKNKSIFIFLTNTGSLAIEKELINKVNEGIRRELTILRDFEKIMISETVQKKGGLFDSLMIKTDSIDFYVPFLPLERKHVKQCIQDAIEELNIKPTQELIDQVFQELTFGPDPINLFSNSGCKRVAQISGRIVSRMNPIFSFELTNKNSEL